ncbi:MAG: alpha-glucosidase [Saprospiraceae bacterium]|nr:alpha-glucosidase [Saprospiraceae bacterium]
MKIKMYYHVLWLLGMICLPGACAQNEGVELESPNGSFVFSIQMDADMALSYSLDFLDQTITDRAVLGFEFMEEYVSDEIMTFGDVTTHSISRMWNPVYGERSEYKDAYNEALVAIEGSNPSFSLRIRAYDEGVAFRYEFTDNDRIHITAERTEFVRPENGYAWVSSRAQSEITKVKVSDINEAKERPLLVEYSDSLYVAIGEAALVDFARMKIGAGSSDSGLLKAHLDGPVQKDGPFHSPWRYIMAARRPGEILEHNYLLLNLNEPSEIETTSWIRPGKVIREVTLTTQGGMACVDFAVKHNLQFVEFDAGWYGNEYDDASDATTITVDPKRSPGPLDLHKVINYAEEHNIGVILYVNRRALEKQLDEVLPLLASWGVAGVKYGFVQVGPQEWTSWLHDAIRKGADHQLMLDIHDEYRPTGYSRTYPNLMTQEGIRGDEESPTNAMVINTLFTRMIAGAGDHTNCYFADRVTEKMGSHVSQMAKTICIYSPWQFLFWYDRPMGSPSKKGGAGKVESGIPEIADLSFYDRVPTVWDDTKVLDGYPGEFATVARKKESTWYLGALTGTKAYDLQLHLDFLDQGRKYKATVYSHDASLSSKTKVRIDTMMVDNHTILHQEIMPQNGIAVIFDPIK